jgi:hypothetical protein
MGWAIFLLPCPHMAAGRNEKEKSGTTRAWAVRQQEDHETFERLNDTPGQK